MRRFFVQIIIAVSLLFFLFPSVGQSIETISISAHNAILMEQQSGRVIFEKDAHERRPIASITKVMTAIIAIENGDLKDKVKVSERAIYTGGSSIYLQKGETMTLEDLLYGLMLRSGNDAAVAIAEHIGGSVEGFVFLMNEKARYLGMTNTNFKNPHGLDEDGHYSSAYDIAVLMRYAMENELFREISGSEHYHSKNRDYRWNNKNKLLTKYYDHCTGGKTGYTKKAGRTLVTTSEKDDLEFISVTLNAPNDWNDHRSLYDWGYENYDLVLLEKKGTRIFETEKEKITGYIEDDVVYPLLDEERSKLTKHVYLQREQTEDMLGKIVYSIQSEPILEVPVYVREEKEKSLSDRIIHSLKRILWLDQNG